jgi:hypothetical protein
MDRFPGGQANVGHSRRRAQQAARVCSSGKSLRRPSGERRTVFAEAEEDCRNSKGSAVCAIPQKPDGVSGNNTENVFPGLCQPRERACAFLAFIYADVLGLRARCLPKSFVAKYPMFCRREEKLRKKLSQVPVIRYTIFHIS